MVNIVETYYRDFWGVLEMKESGILKRNEIEANRFASKVMLISIVFVILFLVIKLIGLFVVPLGTLALALGISAVFLLIPSLLVFVLKKQDPWVKYVIAASAVMAIFCVFTILSHNVVLLYCYPIAIASLYFTRRLCFFTAVLSVVMLAIGQILSVYIGITDNNLATVGRMIASGVVPRTLEFAIIAVIFIYLSRRTRSMLQNVMGAEEQAVLLQKTLAMTEKAREVSGILAESVRQLSAVTDNTTKSNEQIAVNAQEISLASESTIKHMEEAIEMVSRISQSINRIADEGNAIAGISREVRERNEKSGDILHQVIREMDSISQATIESRDVVARLMERSEEIGRFVETITGISEQTNMLALNASIESARAGEQGKGFAVVAAEIRTLAEQSQKAANDIADLIQQITQDTEKAANAMDTNSELVRNGLSLINEAGSVFELLSRTGKDMHMKISEVSQATKNAAADSSKIVEIVEGVRDLNRKNLAELQEIAAAVEQQLASMQEVSASTSSIEDISKDLLEVVEG
jgi:methyl-accepting chemotaxis protein